MENARACLHQRVDLLAQARKVSRVQRRFDLDRALRLEPAHSSAAASRSRMAVVVPARDRTRLAGVDASGAVPNARAAASALSCPTARKTIASASFSVGTVMVTRSTIGSRSEEHTSELQSRP